MVPLFAYGPGAELFGGVLDNTDVARIIAILMGTTLN
jgi:alkaline phosphatase